MLKIRWFIQVFLFLSLVLPSTKLAAGSSPRGGIMEEIVRRKNFGSYDNMKVTIAENYPVIDFADTNNPFANVISHKSYNPFSETNNLTNFKSSVKRDLKSLAEADLGTFNGKTSELCVTIKKGRWISADLNEIKDTFNAYIELKQLNRSDFSFTIIEL